MLNIIYSDPFHTGRKTDWSQLLLLLAQKEAEMLKLKLQLAKSLAEGNFTKAKTILAEMAETEATFAVTIFFLLFPPCVIYT